VIYLLVFDCLELVSMLHAFVMITVSTLAYNTPFL
jgi:hypothetical protein